MCKQYLCVDACQWGCGKRAKWKVTAQPNGEKWVLCSKCLNILKEKIAKNTKLGYWCENER